MTKYMISYDLNISHLYMVYIYIYDINLMADILNGSSFGIVGIMKMAHLWNFMGIYGDVNGNLWDLLCN